MKYTEIYKELKIEQSEKEHAHIYQFLVELYNSKKTELKRMNIDMKGLKARRKLIEKDDQSDYDIEKSNLKVKINQTSEDMKKIRKIYGVYKRLYIYKILEMSGKYDVWFAKKETYIIKMNEDKITTISFKDELEVKSSNQTYMKTLKDLTPFELVIKLLKFSGMKVKVSRIVKEIHVNFIDIFNDGTEIRSSAKLDVINGLVYNIGERKSPEELIFVRAEIEVIEDDNRRYEVDYDAAGDFVINIGSEILI